MIDAPQLHRVIDSMPQASVLVIGDIMLDMYEHCMVKRISPEAPVPIATVTSDSLFLGGAGNVANNARALGARVSLVGVIGDDREGTYVRELLIEKDIAHEGLVVEVGRMTTIKKRVVSGTQQLIRIDREEITDVCEETEAMLISQLAELIQAHDVIIVSDYCKGVLTDAIVSFIKQESITHKKKVLVDSKSKRLVKYNGVHVIKPNKSEAELFAGERFAHDYENLSTIGMRVSGELDTNLVITLGSDGIAVFSGAEFRHLQTTAQQVFDVSGAGDTVLSVMATAIAAGAELYEAVHLSNVAAGYVVSRLGTMTCHHSMLREIL